MKFEWDYNKNTINIKKHNLSFDVVKEIFNDPFHISKIDKRFNYFEERWITIGSTNNGNIIVVGHIYSLKIIDNKEEEVIRLLSARKATKKERSIYDQLK